MTGEGGEGGTAGGAPDGSYDYAAESRGPDEELERLRAQVALTWPAELRHLRMLGVEDGIDVLETGCGPGYLLERWAEAFPASRLTGLDTDARLLERAAAGPVGDAVRWVEADARETGLDGGSFDLVLARYLWQHLPDPERAAAEALRLLRPGGRAVVVDVDAALWGIAHPTFPEVIPIHVKHGRAQAARGGDRRIGRRLWRLLDVAGFAEVHLDALAVHSDAAGLEPFLPQLDPDRQLVSARAGVLSDEEMDVLRSAHERFVAHPDAYVLMIVLVATGIRPPA